MGNLMKYNAANLDQLMDRITRNSIGMDEYFDKLFKVQQESNYPPYNLVQLSNTESKLEIALAGFKKDEVNVYTEYGKLVVKSEKNHKEKEEQTYVVQGLAQRSFERAWTISDDTEVRSVTFEDGLLTIMLGKVVPEHHARKNWLGNAD